MTIETINKSQINYCYVTNQALRIVVIFLMVLISIIILLVHYVFVYLSSDYKLSSNTMQKRSNYEPERVFLVTFALATILRGETGGNGLDVLVAVVGLLYSFYLAFTTRTFANYRLKLLNGLLYLTGLLLLICYFASKILVDVGKPIKRPLLLFFLGFILLVLLCFFLRPKLKLRSLEINQYGYNESSKFLQNIEALIEAYRHSVNDETQSKMMLIL